MDKELQEALYSLVRLIIEKKSESADKDNFEHCYSAKGGVLRGEAFRLRKRILEMLMRDEKTDHMIGSSKNILGKRNHLSNFLWEFILDVKTNPEIYLDEKEAMVKIGKFYSDIVKGDREYEVLFPLKNITISKEICLEGFELRFFEGDLYEKWRSEIPWGLLENEKGKTVLLTTVKANSHWKAVRRGKNKCFSFLALLQILPRFYKKSEICPSGSIFTRTSPDDCQYTRLDEISSETDFPKSNDMDFLERWTDILSSQSTEMTKRVIAGMRFLAEAYSEPEIMIKLIKVFMALETVFTGGKKGAKKFNMMLRIPLFLSRRQKSFDFPGILVYLYNKRNEFMHEATEIELPEVDLIELERDIDDIVSYSSKVYLEMLVLMSEHVFEDHNDFIDWLCREDDVYSATVKSIVEVTPKIKSIAQEAGATDAQMEKVAQEMVKRGKINSDEAKKILKELASGTP